MSGLATRSCAFFESSVIGRRPGLVVLLIAFWRLIRIDTECRSVGASLTLPRQLDRMRRSFGDAERIAGMKAHQNE
jgi:hypothetical protein